ncbi:MAG: hypothetical protein Q9161_000937 [Pseudevernia consocians]
MSPKDVPRPLGLLLFLLLEAFAVIALAIPLADPVSLLNNNNNNNNNNSTVKPTASTPLEAIVPPNATSPSLLLPPLNMFDYHVAGTSLILRITATGLSFTRNAVNTVVDAAIRRVVEKINAGVGNESIDGAKFCMRSADIDVQIGALSNAELTYFILGKQILPRGGNIRAKDLPFCWENDDDSASLIFPPFLLRAYRIFEHSYRETRVLTPVTLAGDVLAGAWQYMNQPWSSFREVVFDIVEDRGSWYYIGYGRIAKHWPSPSPSPPEPSVSLSRYSGSVLNEIE